MKKILCIIISFIMIFGLCSCGNNIDIAGDKVSVRISGDQTKTLTFNIKGELAGCTPKLDYYVDEGGGSVLNPKITRTTDKQIVCKVTGHEMGASGFSIRILKDDETVAALSMFINVGEGLKLECGSISFGDDPEYKEIEGDGTVKIPYTEDNTYGLIKLEKTTGEWTEYFNDPDFTELDVSNSEKDCTWFGINPKAAGKTYIQLINRDEGKLATVDLDLVEVAEEEGSHICVNVISYDVREYTIDDLIADRGQGAVVRKIRRFAPEFRLPSQALIEGWSLYDASTEKPFDFPEDKEPSEVEIPKNIDSLSVDASVGDINFDYTISSAITLEKETAAMTELDAKCTPQTLKIAQTSVLYYNTSYGFRRALWEADGFVHSVIFTNETQIDADNQAVLRGIIEK